MPTNIERGEEREKKMLELAQSSMIGLILSKVVPIWIYRKDYHNSLPKLKDIARQRRNQDLADAMFGKPIHSI